jgi:hypothetical protein
MHCPMSFQVHTSRAGMGMHRMHFASGMHLIFFPRMTTRRSKISGRRPQGAGPRV